MNAPAPLTINAPTPARPGRFSDPVFSPRARQVVIPAFLAFLAIVPHLVPGVSEFLQYDRAAHARGQLWRWVACHWTHWSADHLLWDVGAFLLLGWACARRSVRDFIATVALAALLVPAAAWIAHPELATYRGLSGIDSALLALLAVGVLRDELRPGGRPAVAWACGAVIVGFAGKSLYELASGATVFVDAAAAGFVPVPAAHAAGALVGGAVGLGRRRAGAKTSLGMRA